MKYGLQMYSVRDAAQGDLLGTLEKVGKLGYHYAEFAGFFGIPAEQVKAKLVRHGGFLHPHRLAGADRGQT